MPFTVLHSPEAWPAQFSAEHRTVLTVGNFDGLHLGHQQILHSVAARARATAQRSAVVTFDPHPLRVLRPEQAPQMIQTLTQRLAGFERAGLDAAIVLHFDRELSQVSAEEFVQRILFGNLHAGTILVGSNFRFGHRGTGDIQVLKEFGKTLGFDVETVAPVEVRGQVVSSTLVRAAIRSGNVADALALLGRPFSLTGEIRTGAGRGRALLFPTLNLEPAQELQPGLGVYATETVTAGKAYPSVTNVGTRPTFDGVGVTIESHLFGFDKQVVSGTMEVRFHARIRDERKFAGVEELREQIARDIATAHEYFAGSVGV